MVQLAHSAHGRPQRGPHFLPQGHTSEEELELSIVIPCLNEHETVGTCVRKAVTAMRAAGIQGEVIVADNGSTDGSQSLARKEGARVVDVTARGYGSALMGGIAAAKGRYVIMGDADDSYDFGEAPKFVEKLRTGCDLVQGCRLPAGGGVVKPGAMPWLHRWVGNPGLTFLSQLMFHAPVHDIYCGMRAFTKDTYEQLALRSPGMEFATEMIIKASLFGANFEEVAITLWPDGRLSRRPHLRTFRDGWRTLRLFLVYSPRWLFLYPGLALILCGLLGYGVALPGLKLAGVAFDAHTLLVASMMLLLGFQSVFFAIVTTAYSISHHYIPKSVHAKRFFNLFTLERGMVAGGAGMLAGLGLIGFVAASWAAHGFGTLDYAHTMRLVVPGVTAMTLGASTIFCSFLCSIVGTRE
jgi:glycosyltransferase involved in cell wall biosynthesis